jgi:hypothetical protein
MTHDDIRRTLLENSSRPQEVRTNDGRVFLVQGVERWALAGGRLVVLEGAEGRMNILSVRNVASIGAPTSRRRGRRRRA